MGPRPRKDDPKAKGQGVETTLEKSLRTGSTFQGRSIYGSVMVPEHRRAEPSFFERNLGTTILLIDDVYNLSKLLRDHGFPSVDLNLEDGSRIFETMARITEGSIMGTVIGLRGPGQTTWSKQKEKRKPKQSQAMTLVHSQQYFLELVLAVGSHGGFVIIVGSIMNKAWDYMSVQSLLKHPSLRFKIVELHSCLLGDCKGVCTTLRIATTLNIDPTLSASHSSSCPGAHAKRTQHKKIRAAQRTAQHRESIGEQDEAAAAADDIEAGLNDFSRALVSKFLLPTMRTTLSNKMVMAERYPLTGPSEPVDEDVVHTFSAADSMTEAYPTEQMIKYKKKLKESGLKPVKQNSKNVEQHFDDCGEDTTSLAGLSLAPESYRDNYNDDDYNADGTYRNDEAHLSVVFDLERDIDLSNVVYAFFRTTSDAVAQDFRHMEKCFETIHGFATHRYGHSFYIDILEVMGGGGTYHADPG